MNIYLSERDSYTYDENAAHVVVANNEKEVVELCKSKSAGKEYAIEWDNNCKITLQGAYTGSKTEPFILLTDFYEA